MQRNYHGDRKGAPRQYYDGNDAIQVLSGRTLAVAVAVKTDERYKSGSRRATRPC